MTHAQLLSDIKGSCDFIAAILAFAAAAAWFTAARQRVAKKEPAMWSESAEHPAVRALNAGIERGVRWNQRAALLTGLSALATFLSWLSQRFT